ncbi:MFS transporter [Streptomyces sp. NBC_01443]|uniref:MFS transporter n=1 Tax=Streptomyces sp. NBC_01443 TaxID=2903868 RepID=UPI00225124A9|nr:MFS transporter [Streptomyces sp. NBC_01443]MCX4628621.1 MFS transporter [Streptomyces sp. NBC_01443]
MGLSLRDYVPATAAGRTFALTSLISATGTGLFLAGSAVFFVRSVGLSSEQVGVGLAAAAAVGFLTTVPIGALGDRIGVHRTLIGLQLWRAAWFVVLAFVEGPVAFTVVASCLAMAEAATSPVSQAVVAAVTGDTDRTRTVAVIRTVRNVGFSLGSLLAVPLLAGGGVWCYRMIVLGNAAAFVFSATLLGRIDVPRSAARQRAEGPLAGIRGFRDWRYLALTAVNGVLTLHMTILSIGIPLWVVQATAVPGEYVPLVVLANTVLVVLLQVPFAKGVERPGGALRALRLGGLALAACCLCLGLAADRALPAAFALVAAAGVLMTLGELWQSAGGWELSYEYAPEPRRGIYLAVFSLGTTGQEIVGPALITSVVIATGLLGWAALAVLFCLATLLAGPTTAALNRRSAGLPEPVPVGGPS